MPKEKREKKTYLRAWTVALACSPSDQLMSLVIGLLFTKARMTVLIRPIIPTVGDAYPVYLL